MALPKLIPALADLTQDIAGPLPVELFREWVAGNQDVDKAESLLRPFEISGTVVATDSSGLSRLTAERDLLDVLAIVSQPKEIVHALGAAVGGRAIGTWVADNSEMYYPLGASIGAIVGAMLEAHARIAAEAEIRIGMCVHEGSFYEIGGGLYGRDAEDVEYLAERFAAPGEILLTQPVAARVDAGAFPRDRRAELDVVFPPGVFTVTSGPRSTELVASTDAYPHPFPDAFFHALLTLRASRNPDALRKEIYGSLLQERTIVFVTRERDAGEAATITGLLDNLATNAVMEAVVNASPAARDHVASLGGGLAILSFEDPQPALVASLALRDAFVQSGLPAKIGIDVGPVLLFTKQRGPSGISGEAVNIASKISDDAGVVNMVSLTTRAAARVRDVGSGVPFSATISRVTLSGIRV